MVKVGRNDACPCGSGKKYKVCCGKAAEPDADPSDATHEGAIEISLSWLDLRHRKAFNAAVQDEIDGAVLECIDFEFDEDEEDDVVDELTDAAIRQALEGLEDDVLRQIHINITEWVMAEGDIAFKDDSASVAELLLSDRGPALSAPQRAWIGELASRPLRLYEVTGVVPGSGITLCDALETAQMPIFVQERLASQSLKVGTAIGARVLAVRNDWQMSGALYVFGKAAGREAMAVLRDLAQRPSKHVGDDVFATGVMIIQYWLAQFLEPPDTPSFARATSDEPAPASQLPPHVVTEVVGKAIRRMYAHWPEEPIPALGNKTPRQAMRTAAGLERVKGLLREYQQGEEQMAARDGREPASYRFLWEALGLGGGDGAPNERH